MRFKIEEHSSQLNVNQRWWYVFWLCISQGIALLLTFLVFAIPYNKLIEVYEYAYFIYFIPAIPMFHLLKKLYHFLKRRTFSFVKHEDALYQNKKFLVPLTGISHLELAYKERGENEELILQIATINDEVIVMAKGSAFSGLKKTGIRIAKFLNIEFINTNPVYDRVIWGGVNASESEISFLEDGM